MDGLAISSAFALLIRLLAVGVLVRVASYQIRAFGTRGDVEPLKRFLFVSVLAIVVSNLPILCIHWVRTFGYSPPGWMLLVAPITNAVGLLVAAVMLLQVYRFKDR